MKFLTYSKDEAEAVGVLSNCGCNIYTMEAFGLNYKTMQDLIENITDSEMKNIYDVVSKGSEYKIPLESVKKMSPIPRPKQDVICLGINYMAHAEESARFKKEAFGGERPYAIYFSKRVNLAVPDGGYIDGHFDIVDSLDYEAELAVIIGKDAKNVSKEDAKNYIFGYTIINDVSARNIQTRHKQWYFGKGLDTFTPMGPVIVTADEINYPPKLNITSKVNGEIRQNSNTELLIFGIDHIISELSQGMTLKAGTIIATGTPAGVGMGMTPPCFLKSGDVVECAIESIGSITNTIK